MDLPLEKVSKITSASLTNTTLMASYFLTNTKENNVHIFDHIVEGKCLTSPVP